MTENVLRHRLHEDAIALVLGTLFVALGIANRRPSPYSAGRQLLRNDRCRRAG